MTLQTPELLDEGLTQTERAEFAQPHRAVPTTSEAKPGTEVVEHAPRLAHLTDSGNAEVFVAMYGDLVRYDHARGRWLLWDVHRWRPDDDAAVHRMALQSVRARLQAVVDDSLMRDDREKLAKHAIRSEARPRLDALLALARTMKPITDSGKGWDEAPGLVGVPNGVVDLRTGELRPGRQSDRITMQTSVEYDPQAVCPRWGEFLLEVLDDAEVVRLLQRLAGYSLTAEAVLDKLIFLMGVGRNGKSTLIEYLTRAVGEYATAVSPLAFLDARKMSHSTEVADLALARFAYCEELADDTLNAGRLKALSGGSPMRARKMRENTVQFKQTWQLWFTTNALPRSNDNSWGFWSRVVAVDFPRIFTGTEEPDLEEKLAAELSGILAWAVRGATAWYAGGIGGLPQAVVEKTAQYRDDLDPLSPLFEHGYLERCEPETWTPTVNLMTGYRAHANAGAWPVEKQWSETHLGSLLAAQFTKKRHKVLLADGSHKQMVGYHGVRLGPSTLVASATSWRFETGEELQGFPATAT